MKQQEIILLLLFIWDCADIFLYILKLYKEGASLQIAGMTKEGDLILDDIGTANRGIDA